jgi:hypothetical protein
MLFLSFSNNMTGATNGAETASLPEFIPQFLLDSRCSILRFFVVFCGSWIIGFLSLKLIHFRSIGHDIGLPHATFIKELSNDMCASGWTYNTN